MINLGDKPSAPAVLSAPKITTALEYLRTQLAENGAISSNDFKKINHWTKVKKELSDYQNEKCCYCERGRDSNGETDVEHFRPKNSKDDKPSPGHNGYWWLAYNWDNLFFVCKECNEAFKRNEFPLINDNENSRAYNEGDNLSEENHIFFNLINENPEEYIAYDLAKPVPQPIPRDNDVDMRAKKTIDILGLARRSNLAAGRSIKLQNMRFNASLIHYYINAEGKEDQLSAAKELLNTHTNAKSNFAGFARYFYISQGLGEYIDEY